MAFVVTEGAVLRCSHGGQLQLAIGDPRVTVYGRKVITGGMEGGLVFGSTVTPVPGMITPCAAQTPTSPPVSRPCVTAPTTPVGLALKLTVGGRPVLLDTATGTTVSGSGPGTWTVASAGQTTLEAV